MAVVIQFKPPRARQPRYIGIMPMPDGSSRKFKGHDAAEVARRWQDACESMRTRMERTAARRHQMAEYSRLRRQTLKEHGICQCCGVEDTEPGYVQCAACRLYNNQRRSGARTAPLSPYRDGRREQ